ncbi:MAG: hypothetical protein KC684_08400 [Candidatus Omnitrophica bacterium]|nr:hypothetical protein [Candidatus Omnitrophota bacterium]
MQVIILFFLGLIGFSAGMMFSEFLLAATRRLNKSKKRQQKIYIPALKNSSLADQRPVPINKSLIGGQSVEVLCRIAD